jgi:serine/threonine-protein kinase RsbW
MVTAPHTTTRWARTIAACHGDCHVARDLLADALENHGWTEEQAFRVLVCASEALANAVNHGSDRDDAVQVRCTVSATRATMVIADTGGPSAPMPNVVPDEVSEHGRGLLLMRALADTLRIRRLRTGTLMALAFRAG